MLLDSTAYPTLNFNSNLTFASRLGHFDVNLNFTNSKDLQTDPSQTLGIRLMLVRFMKEDEAPNDSDTATESRTSALVEVRRPISNIDYKFMIT